MQNIETGFGTAFPLGLSHQGKAWNFSLYSSSASTVRIGLFSPGSSTPFSIFSLNRTGDIWHISIHSIPKDTLYAYQCDSDQWLLDPYAKYPHGSKSWNKGILTELLAEIREAEPFDWQNTSSPHLPKENLIIYEMHVRGFTNHSSSGIKNSGTYTGIIEKIPYLNELGITAIQLMPIFEFDECRTKNLDPKTQMPLPNYWGYNPLSFFGIKRSYGELREFKTLVRELHKQKIEVFLDVVYNHTGEGKLEESALSWRGIDNKTYYLVDPSGHYLDYTGCKNTINANHPIVQELILASLRYFVKELHVDGFRFDLASILTRDTDGKPMDHPPLLSAIAKDPLLSSVKLIAEPWDAKGLYQIGHFPKWGPWLEWNGKFRDIARRFIKGNENEAGHFASVLSGSDFLYKTPLCSVNFITAHDGYSLHDLVTYEKKHNLDNGEMNFDGSDQNDNWNCGVEGETQNLQINHLRGKQMRNHLLALFLSQGIPMLLMGDEYGHTRLGNNNPYVQDNEINWFLWDELEKNRDIFHFVQALISFRKKHPELRRTRFLTNADIEWHGILGTADWSKTSHFVAFSTKTKFKIFAAFNANPHSIDIQLPQDNDWRLVIDTKEDWKFHDNGPSISSAQMESYSALLAVSHQ